MKTTGKYSPKPTAGNQPSYRQIAEQMPKCGDLRWVLEYAIFHYQWACEAIASIEARATGLLKAIGAVIGAGWAVLLWAGAGIALPRGLLLACLLAVTGALGAAVAECAMVLIPSAQATPWEEYAAFACAMDNPAGADPAGRFAAFLAQSTEIQIVVAHRKGRRLRAAFIAVTVAIATALAFLAAASAHRISKLSPAPAVGSSLSVAVPVPQAR